MARKNRKSHPGRGIPRKSRKRDQRYAHRRNGRITARHTLTRILNRFGWETAERWLAYEYEEHGNELLHDVILRNTRGMNREEKARWASRRSVPASLLN